MGSEYLYNYMISLQKQLDLIAKTVFRARTRGLDLPIHPIKPGDYVYIKLFTGRPLEEKWMGPYQVQLTTHTAVKVKEQAAWIHYSKVKKAPARIWTTTPIGPAKLRFFRS